MLYKMSELEHVHSKFICVLMKIIKSGLSNGMVKILIEAYTSSSVTMQIGQKIVVPEPKKSTMSAASQRRRSSSSGEV